MGHVPTESEKDKMLQGRLYRALDPELMEERTRCRRLVAQFNANRGAFTSLCICLRRRGSRNKIHWPIIKDASAFSSLCTGYDEYKPELSFHSLPQMVYFQSRYRSKVVGEPCLNGNLWTVQAC